MITYWGSWRRELPRLVSRHGLTLLEIDDLVDVLSIQVEVIALLPITESELRDVEDQPVLGNLFSAIMTSDGDSLITGGKDLRALVDRYPIFTPAQFWATHAGL